jgi:2'-5' RNA ligase
MNDGVMLAFIPLGGEEWCKQPDPHMTLVYAGTIDDVTYPAFGELCKDALNVVRVLRRPFMLNVTGVEQFGGNDDGPVVDVLKLESTREIQMARRIVQTWNKSQHPFDPHATIGPEGSADGILPTQLYFDRILAAWGPKKLIFRLGDSPRDY